MADDPLGGAADGSVDDSEVHDSEVHDSEVDDSGVDDAVTTTAALVRIVESAAGVDLDTDVGDGDEDGHRNGDDGGASGTTTVVGRDGTVGPAERLPSLLADAGSIVGVVPRLDASLVERLTAATAAEMEARIVLTGRAGTRLTGPARPAIRSSMADRGADLCVHDGDSPIGILLVDDRAVVGLFDGRGLAAVLATDDPAVRGWAAETYRRYADAAEPL